MTEEPADQPLEVGERGRPDRERPATAGAARRSCIARRHSAAGLASRA